MAGNLNLEIEGLEEFERDLMKAINKSPTEARTTLRKTANAFRKSAKKRTPDSGIAHEKKLKKKYGVKIKEKGVDMTALVYNSAPHYHLVERGHNLVKNGKTIGFVTGQHMMEKTKNEFEGIVPEEFEKMIDKVLREERL